MTLKSALRDALRPLYKREQLMLLCKELGDVSLPESSRRLEVIALGPGHRDRLEQFMRVPQRDVAASQRALEACLAIGCDGQLALLNDEIIGYRWSVAHTVPHPHLAMYGMSLREGDAYAFGLYIAPPLRSQGYAREFLAITMQHMQQQGYQRLYNVVHLSNTPARRVHASFGARELGPRVTLTFFSRLVYAQEKWLHVDPVWI